MHPTLLASGLRRLTQFAIAAVVTLGGHSTVRGTAVAFPNTDLNLYDVNRVQDRLVSVQSVVVDPMDRLWVVDTGSIQLGPAIAGVPVRLKPTE